MEPQSKQLLDRMTVLTPDFDPPDRATVAKPDVLNAHLNAVFRPFMGDKPHEIRVHPAAFAMEPQGNRLLVVCYPKPEKYGALVLPHEDGYEPMGMGVVMSVGGTAGAFRSSGSLGGVPYYPDPKQLLLKTVIFGAHSGKTLRLSYTRDVMFSSQILILTSADIWCVLEMENYAEYQMEHDYFRTENPL